MGRGPVIGVDVAANRTLFSVDLDFEESSLWHLLRSDRRQVPWILRTLMRAGTVSGDVQNAMLHQSADLIIAPPLESVDLLDWGDFDRIVELGDRHTSDILERFGGSPYLRLVA